MEEQKNVLVTGATGFVGSALASYLHKQGYQVRALTRQHNSKHVLSHHEYDWVFGDITQPDSISSICTNIDIVFHAAGYAHALDVKSKEYIDQHQSINYQGTINILAACKKANVKRLVFFSSVKACADQDRYVDESCEEKPKDAYGLAKLNAEQAVISSCNNDVILSAVIIRPSLIYGVGCKANLSAMIRAIDKGFFPPPPPGINKKSLISLDDLCRVAQLAGEVPKDRLKHYVFIATDSIEYSTSKIYHLIRDALKKEKINWYLPKCVWYILAKVGDIFELLLRKELPLNTNAVNKLFATTCYGSKYIKEELGFEPKQTLEDVLPEMIAAQRSL